MKSGNSEIKTLDSLRGAAAFAVCLYHFVCTTTGYINNEFVLNVFSFGKHGVQLFFVISGFVIPWSMLKGGYELRNFFKFFGKRLLRLEPPYLVSLLLAITILAARTRLLGPDANLQELSASRIALHLGYLIPYFPDYKWINQVYWTLAVEFQYYFAMALIFSFVLMRGKLARIVLYCLTPLAAFLSSSSFLPYWFPIFMLGVLLFLVKSKIIETLEFWIVSTLLLVFGVYFYSMGDILFATLGVVAIYWFPSFESKIGKFFGDQSYSLYLIHPIIGATAVNLLSHHFNAPYQKFLVISLGVFISVAGAYLMYLFVERPSRNYSRKLTYKV